MTRTQSSSFLLLAEEIDVITSDEPSLKRFVGILRAFGVSHSDSERAIREIAGAQSGALNKGDRFRTVASYELLCESEKVVLKQHYLSAMETAEKRFPSVFER